ncbi:MAG: histidine kinase [Oscillospiraceae bacterium]|nr:histidine kinase [Oscillospiraceae bacterium]
MAESSYKKQILFSGLLTICMIIPAVMAELLLLQSQAPPLLLLGGSLLLAACLLWGILLEIRRLRSLRRTAQILEDICAINPDYALDEDFIHMGLVEQLNYILTSKIHDAQEEYESTLLAKQAELFALQSQINPHFLYNTLDSIRGQAVTDGAAEIAETIEALSNLFKYNISRKETLIPLRLEIDNLIYYMKIQKYRFLDKISLVLDIEDNDNSLLNTKIPKLTLQPIIENAICHGLEPKLEKGTIKIRVFVVGDILRITVADDGVGMDEETLLRIKKSLYSRTPEPPEKKSSHGIALHNANRRIQQCFGPNYGLNIYSTKMIGTRVELSFPYGKESYNDGHGTVQMRKN